MATKKTAKKAATKRAVSPAKAVDAQLARYRSMRDFSVTAEPSGGSRAGAKGELPFVIQKHAASHLHYDFRLAWNGVLKSWAVAKGPSYFTGDKRLAVQVEDHPIEYGGFEGIIPKGQYGGGTVMVWDQGTWEPQAGHTDVDAALHAGSLKFTLHGTKLKGNWALVRMGGKAGGSAEKPNWLLIKEHDGYEYPADATPITEGMPDSVVTGRSIEEIARSEDHVWNSKETVEEKAPVSVTKKKSSATMRLPAMSRLPKERLPEFIAPQLAQQASEPPTSEGWLHELKLDGYRIQARKQGSNVQLLTRNGLDWTHRMPTIAAQVAALPVEDALLDGEVVVLTAQGTTSFADLQAAFEEGRRKPLTYFVFDLLHLDGHDTRELSLRQRKELLAQILEGAGEYVRFSEHLETSGEVMFRKACELHAEGIISKRANGRYISGRSSDWLKIKCVHEQEFVVGGFTLPSKGHAGMHGVGALLLGYYEGRRLIYAGRTGTGFTQKTHGILRTKLEELRRETSPFHETPRDSLRDHPIWVAPKLVAQVHFATWTADNLVRQAAFQGLREDKPAADVRREEPQPSASYAAPKRIVARTAPSASGGHAPVRLTHPEKVLDADSGLTKQMLADYYWAVADAMLPYIADRPLSLVRCPEGSGHPCFYQKHANHMLPPSVGSIEIADKAGKAEPYITFSTPEALASLAQIDVLEVHPWGSRNEDLEHPDRLIFDLDPDVEIGWKQLANAAAEVRKLLKQAGLESFLKLTGGKGLHVVAPIEPEYAWPVVKEFAHALMLELERQKPALYLTKMTKAARKGRIFLDYLRNERGATAVAVFSPRARPGAAVSMSLSWSELKLEERPVFSAASFSEWKKRLSRDPWKELPRTKQGLTAEALKALRVPV
ncbi:MAG TPA: DNA ligase D [Granulicella sp.]